MRTPDKILTEQLLKIDFRGGRGTAKLIGAALEAIKEAQIEAYKEGKNETNN